MPYLRITCPKTNTERQVVISKQLTSAVVELFHHPGGGPTMEELCERTTVHWTAYEDRELFIGGRTPAERGVADITVEVSDWNMSVRQQRKIARSLTPLLMELFDISHEHLDNINIRFHSYPPTDFAVGGRLLSEIVCFWQIEKSTIGD